jgi:lysophospholipase
LERNGEAIPQVCQQCFTDYCWNGTTVDKAQNYTPSMILSQLAATDKDSGVGKFVPNVLGLAMVAAVSGFLMM